MMAKKDEPIVLLQIRTEEGLRKLKQDAERCREQARLHGSTLEGRIYRAITQGLEMVAIQAPAEIADITIQATITPCTGNEPLSRFEQRRAMEMIRKCVQNIEGYERLLMMRKKRGRDYRPLSAQALSV